MIKHKQEVLDAMDIVRQKLGFCEQVGVAPHTLAIEKSLVTGQLDFLTERETQYKLEYEMEKAEYERKIADCTDKARRDGKTDQWAKNIARKNISKVAMLEAQYLYNVLKVFNETSFVRVNDVKDLIKTWRA
jgi:hypothetical protein